MIHTKYSHMTDEELVSMVLNKTVTSELEHELANRLGESNDIKETLEYKLGVKKRVTRPGAGYPGDA